VASTPTPNPVSVLWSVVRALRTVPAPRPTGSGELSHSALEAPLRYLAKEGPRVLADLTEVLDAYLGTLIGVDPDTLSRHEALATWINVYNTGALLLAGRAQRDGRTSVLRVPGGFRHPFLKIAGEELSLDDIEHAKLRRFGDPRIHTALVCGSVSCPTLRGEPYSGSTLSKQLDDQTSYFLASGGCVVERDRHRVSLSRVFLWFGGDFVRPHRMPTFLPPRRRSLLEALIPWLPAETAAWVRASNPEIEFQRYDWGLSCTVR